MSPLNHLRRIVSSRLSVPESRITEDVSLIDLGADSLKVVEIAFDIEQIFDFEIPDEELENAKTIGAAVRMIERLCGREVVA